MNSNKYFILFLVFMIAGFLTGCGEKKQDTQTKGQTKTEKKENIVREDEIIDVGAIDVNMNGMLFECPMDWNVIDDKPNSCPTCGMDLEEFTVVKVKENLVNNGYKVK